MKSIFSILFINKIDHDWRMTLTAFDLNRLVAFEVLLPERGVTCTDQHIGTPASLL